MPIYVNWGRAVPLSRVTRSVDAVRKAQRRLIVLSLAIQQADDRQRRIDPRAARARVDEAVSDLETPLRLLRAASTGQLFSDLRKGVRLGPRHSFSRKGVA